MSIPEKNIPLIIEKVKNSELEKSKSVHNAITNSATNNSQQIYISNRNQYGGTFQVDIHNKEKRPTANEIIYELLDKINPTIRDSIKKDSRNICIMISQPNLIRLMDYKEELSTEKILQIKSNGSVNSGIGNRFSNCINDLDEGYLVGYNLFAMENFNFK